ncbi:MAG TPA: DDE-type integrase/transposase/recombinase [Acidimicrobiales bacterium]|nr:DDE-type integrase/transposase/recombinase [Acidimicrobiales bacterium]
MNEAQRNVALFRYSLIREAADESLTIRQRGALVRELAARTHTGPGARSVRVTRGTLDRWIRAYRAGGFEALAPQARTGEPVTEQRLLDLAEALKREVPRRTAAQVTQIIRTAEGTGPSERTVQRHFARLGLNTRPDGSPPQAFGRFEAAAAGDLWTGDALHGPVIGGRKTYLFAFIDDHSRALVGYRFGLSEDTVRLEAAFRAALASRGIPRACYLDNGSAMVSKQLLRACASLGIRLVHSRPGRPQGRGKIERVFETVRIQFLVEIEARPPADVAELNRLFSAWVETVYHRRVHTETGEAPIDRLLAGAPPVLPTPASLHEAFLWSEVRTVTKTATVSLHANTFEVDAALVGSRVDVVFNPFDLTSVEIRFQGRPMGQGVPVTIGRHSHPQARPEATPAPAPTGIDYLGLLAERREAELAGSINYAQLAFDGSEHPYPIDTNDCTTQDDDEQEIQP